jgi:protein-disulfide isomerase
MEEENSSAETKTDEITISKKNLWMYSTFVLVAILIIGGVFWMTGKSTGTGGTVSDIVDLSAFTSNPSLYPALGPENANDVVIEFSDFQCPYCAISSGLPSWAFQYSSQYVDLFSTSQKVKQLAEEGKIRLIYVPMSFLGDESIYAVEAALCANEQGKFWEMHDLIFANHDGKENNGKYSKENLKKFAAQIEGLDTAKFNECLDSSKYLSNVKLIASEASKATTGTPVFYVNGKKLPASWSQISAELK